jgi:hypothetical protein
VSGVSGLVLDGIRPQTFLLKRFEGHKWSIAQIAFVAVQEILDQREVRDRVGGAIDLGNQRTTMRKFQGYDCVQFTALVFGKSWASQARVKLQFTSLSKFYRESPSNYFDFDKM